MQPQSAWQCKALEFDVTLAATGAWQTCLKLSKAQQSGHVPDALASCAQVMYPVCLVLDMIFIFHELKAIHLRTLNRERAEMLADRYVSIGTVRSPADIARQERVFFASDFDRSGISVRFVPIHQLFDSQAELEAAAAACQGGFVMRLRRQGSAPRKRQQRRRPWLPFGRGECYLGIALHKDAVHQQVLAAVLAACATRQALQNCAPVHLHPPLPPCDCGHLGPASWWHESGALSRHAEACLQWGQDYGLQKGRHLAKSLRDHGWLTAVFMLGKLERARFSTRLRRPPGGVRWLTFR